MARILAPLWNAILTRLARAVQTRLDVTQKVQVAQLEVLKDEVRRSVEVMQAYGFTSAPLDGCEHVVAHVMGGRDHGISIATEDRRYRKIIAAGEVAVYDDQAQFLHLKRGPEIHGSSDVIRLEAGGSSIVIDSSGVTIVGASTVSLEAGGKSIDVAAAGIDLDG